MWVLPLLVLLAYGDDATFIKGSGSSGAAVAFEELAFSYSLAEIEPRVHIEYEASSSARGIQDVMRGEVTWAGSSRRLSRRERAAAPHLCQVPLFQTPVVALYNLPGVEGAPLSLDGEVLVGIFRGDISRWRDPSILAQNPALASTLPNQEIRVLRRRDRSATTLAFSRGLKLLAPLAFGDREVHDVWPEGQVGGMCTGSRACAALCSVTPYSITYGSFAYAATYGLSHVGDPFNASWPITMTNFAVINGSEPAPEIRKWFHWITHDPSVLPRMDRYAVRLRPSDPVRPQRGFRSQCDAASEMQMILVPQRSNSTLMVVLAAVLFSAGLVLFVGLMLLLKGTSNLNEMLYLCAVMIGFTTMLAGTAPWTLVPNSVHICAARAWVPGLGFAIVQAALLGRLAQIRHILVTMRRTNDRDAIAGSTLLRLGVVVFFVIVGLHVVFFLVWALVDPFVFIYDVVDPVNSYAHLRCRNHPALILVLSSINMVLLIAAIVSLYLTWDYKAKVRESRWLFIFVYSVAIVFMMVGLVRVLGGDTQSEDFVSTLTRASFLFISFLCALLIFVPRAYTWVLELRAARMTSSSATLSSVPQL